MVMKILLEVIPMMRGLLPLQIPTVMEIQMLPIPHLMTHVYQRNQQDILAMMQEMQFGQQPTVIVMVQLMVMKIPLEVIPMMQGLRLV